MRLLVLLVAALVAAAARVDASEACAVENLSQNRVYPACSDLPTLGACTGRTTQRRPRCPSPSSSRLSRPATGSPGGLNPTGDGMVGTQALFAAPKGGAGAYGVQTYDIQGASLGSPGRIAYPTSDLAAVLGSDDRVQMFGKLTLHNGTEEVNQTRGILNAVSWGILLPIGGMVARYLKTFKSAEPAWLYLHIASCQLIAYMMGLCGFAIDRCTDPETQQGSQAPRVLELVPPLSGLRHHYLGIVNVFKGMTILNVEEKLKTGYIITIGT
ncbi:hypothetical protein ZWY2020_005875 [Hordeum vulgare]|nr:hypothetical protein ZWY2020_005875 [Hordeum vulgare]